LWSCSNDDDDTANPKESFTTIDDANFEQALIDLEIDDTRDGQVRTSAIDELTSLDVSGKAIENLSGIEAFVALTTLNASDNALEMLDLSKNVNLTELNLAENQLPSLDVTVLTALETLDASANALETLDLSKNIALTELYLHENAFTAIDLEANTALIRLDVSTNELVTLEVENNTALTFLKANDNLLTVLDLTTNTSLEVLDVQRTETLTCIKLGSDEEAGKANAGEGKYANWKKDDEATYAGVSCDGQPPGFTAIPDNVFEQYLIDRGWDDVLDGQVLTASIVNVTSIAVNAPNINDFTGIEAFESLRSFIYNNGSNGGSTLTTLDLRNNTNLESLSVTGTDLNDLKLEGLTRLDDVNLQHTEITSFSFSLPALSIINIENNARLSSINISQSPNLGSVYIGDSPLLRTLDITASRDLEDFGLVNTGVSSLNISQNTSLVSLLLDSNSALRMLDLSTNTALEEVTLTNNALTALDVSTNTALLILAISNNVLQNLDVRNNTKLVTLSVSDNALSAIDLSANADLEVFQAKNTSLESLDISNNLKLRALEVSNNGNLNCIQVAASLLADIQAGNGNYAFWQIDAGTVYSANCNQAQQGFTAIPDNAFEQYLINQGWDDVLDGQVLTASIEGVQTIDIAGRDINDFTGIEAFEGLTRFVYDNGINGGSTLTALDLRNSKGLETLSITGTRLNDLKLEGLTNLNTAVVQYTELTDFDFFLPRLRALTIKNNAKLTRINLPEALDLFSVFVENCPVLSTLNFTDSWGLERVGLLNTGLTSLDISKNLYLVSLYSENTNISTLDISQNAGLQELIMINNKLTTLDVSANDLLFTLVVNGNALQNLNVSNNRFLRSLNVSDNNISAIDVRANPDLQFFFVNNNALESLDISNNRDLVAMEAEGNENLSCIQVDAGLLADIQAGNGNYASWLIDAGTFYSSNCVE